MKFLDYIRGKRKGADAHRIEYDSMRDPFLYDAIEGFDTVDGDHIARIEQLQARMKAKRGGGNNTVRKHPLWQAAAACGVIILGGGLYLFVSHERSAMYAQESNGEAFIDIYVPEAYYEENKEIIEEKNVVLAESHKPNITAFRIAENLSATVTEEELEILAADQQAQRNQEVIDIYMPDGYAQSEPQAAMNKRVSVQRSVPVNGFEKFNAYLKANIKRPTDIDADKQGKVSVEFSVDETGQPHQFVIISGLCKACDKEAVRLIQSGPKWIPSDERVTVDVIF